MTTPAHLLLLLLLVRALVGKPQQQQQQQLQHDITCSSSSLAKSLILMPMMTVSMLSVQSCQQATLSQIQSTCWVQLGNVQWFRFPTHLNPMAAAAAAAVAQAGQC
jgi:hypothetical protein